MTTIGQVILIPVFLYDDAVETIPAYISDAIANCSVFFVENERTARRFIKKIRKETVIDDQEWFTIHKAEDGVKKQFIDRLKQGKNIGILSESGCPGIADPGQILIEAAQHINANKCTQIFIETPYRNNQLLKEMVESCIPDTRICIASNITGPQEFIKTKKAKEWKNQAPDLHKQLVIFLLMA